MIHKMFIQLFKDPCVVYGGSGILVCLSCDIFRCFFQICHLLLCSETVIILMYHRMRNLTIKDSLIMNTDSSSAHTEMVILWDLNCLGKLKVIRIRPSVMALCSPKVKSLKTHLYSLHPFSKAVYRSACFFNGWNSLLCWLCYAFCFYYVPKSTSCNYNPEINQDEYLQDRGVTHDREFIISSLCIEQLRAGTWYGAVYLYCNVFPGYWYSASAWE